MLSSVGLFLNVGALLCVIFLFVCTFHFIWFRIWTFGQMKGKLLTVISDLGLALITQLIWYRISIILWSKSLPICWKAKYCFNLLHTNLKTLRHLPKRIGLCPYCKRTIHIFGRLRSSASGVFQPTIYYANQINLCNTSGNNTGFWIKFARGF